MHFVSYYYDKHPEVSSYYTDCSIRLEKQLATCGYKYSFDYIDFDGLGLDSSYLKLNMIKPSFLLKKMKELNDSVVWIDADCVVQQKLGEFENLDAEYDIAVCIRHHDGITPHAGFIYFNNTKNSIQFLEEWQTINEIKGKDPNYLCSEHCTLIDLYQSTNIPLRKKELINYAGSGEYHMENMIPRYKVWIGISPAAWEYEKTREHQ